MPPHQLRRILLRQRSQRAQGPGPHIDVVVLHQALDGAGPADGEPERLVAMASSVRAFTRGDS